MKRSGKIEARYYIGKNCVIPAKAGIQMINNSPRKWGNIMDLSASQSVFYDWIPAFAGMTA